MCLCLISQFILNCPLLGRPTSGTTEQTPLAQTLQFYFADGRVIAANVKATHIDWTSVADDGRSELRKIRLADIQKIILTESPAAKQIAEIRQLIEQLDSDTYFQREAAEKKLSDPKFAAAFYDLIAQRTNDDRLEVRYRLRRILARLDDDRVQAPLRFDTLTLKSGETMQGDAGVFEWQGDFLDQKITLRRNELTMVDASRNQPVVRPPGDSTPIQVKLFYRHDDFVNDEIRRIDFSEDPSGNTLERRDNVNDVFIPWGLQFTPQGKGYIGIPGFSIPSDDLPVGGKSIARFNDFGRNGIPYKGVISFRFCVPNQANLPAGVTKFGTFIATVDSPRAFVLEAFDVHGDLVGVVESPATDCGFLGIESSVPIHQVQIRANPYLYRVDGNVDEDFALDTFFFSEPTPVATPPKNNRPLVVLGDGTRFTGKINFQPGNKIQLDATGIGKITVPLAKVAEISLGRVPTLEPQKWIATTTDGSSVFVDPAAGFESRWLGKIAFNDIASLHNSSNPKRYPIAGDFDEVNAVLVYPTCRLPLAKIKLTDTGYSWPKNSQKYLQPVDEKSPLGIPGLDPTPQVNRVIFSEATADTIPTLWRKKPTPLASGYVRLIDGQTLALGSKLKIKTTQTDAIVLTNGRREIRLPIDQVSSIFQTTPALSD
jgi:hypothetical protein